MRRRFNRFNINTHANLRNMTELTNEQILRIAPSVGTMQAHENTSTRYQHYNTLAMVNLMREHNWVPFSVSESNTRVESREGFQKHMIRFRPKDVDSLTVGDSVGNAVLVNSHDGTSSYQLWSAILKLKCTNGLVVSEKTFEPVRMRHTNPVEQIIDAQFRVLDGFQGVADAILTAQNFEVSPQEQAIFARAALALRWDTENGVAPVEDRQLLTVRRPDDNYDPSAYNMYRRESNRPANNLYTTFNVVQENLIKGGLPGQTATGSNTTTREVKAVQANMDLNRALWTLQQEFQKLKNAA